MRVVLALILVAAPLAAQQQQAASNAAVAAVKANWEESQDYILRSAVQMPESLYSYKPTAVVRSFGEILAHVAGSEYFYCAAALGEQPRDENELMKTATTKATIVQAVKDAAAYCARAYAMTDAQASAQAANVGRNHDRLYALAANFGHNMEHYGNLITYFRINGMVPPSSQPR